MSTATHTRLSSRFQGLSLEQLAQALGGEIVGGEVLCAGPQYSARDRSLAVRLSAQSPFGFITHSYANDDWHVCRDYVLEKLGLPHFEPGRRFERTQQPPQDDDTLSDAERTARALSFWREARPLGARARESV
jgi:hypothetical protein